MTDDAQRSKIIAGAKTLFLDNGYGKTTTNEIAAKCRISKQTLYRLFPDKLTLFAAVVEAHRIDMIEVSEEYDELPLDVALEKIFKLDIDDEADEARMRFMTFCTVEAVRYPELKTVLQKHGGDKTRNELAEWLTRQQSRGRIHVENPNTAAQILMDMVFGIVVIIALGDYDWPVPDERTAYFKRCIQIFLNGVVPREPC